MSPLRGSWRLSQRAIQTGWENRETRIVDLRTELEAHLGDWQAGWNIGSFGAIAEFHQDAHEATLIDEPLTRATARGAIRIDRLHGVIPVAWEALSKNPKRWQQGIALCLADSEARKHARTVLTELGPDTAAIRAEDRSSILFDLGLGQANHDFCVRTSDEGLLEVLRAQADRPLMEPNNPAMGAILKTHPHRVALSAIGRVEVFQKIGGPDTGGVSPNGPHTHVFPKLLAAGRSHSRNMPIPPGLMPCANLHPGNPTMSPLGEDRTFDAELFARFQRLLEVWGPQEYITTKRQIWQAIEAGSEPVSRDAPNRATWTATRNAIRQRVRTHGSSALVTQWSSTLDRGRIKADADLPGH